jgi:phytoene dehydrogenase-like protein
MSNTLETLIIGAGYSGLTLGALLSKAGHPVTLLEGHGLPGGCGSFYQRGPYRFDVGATTLSGILHDGPLKRLMRELDLQTPLDFQTVGMNIHTNRGVLKRVASHQEWLAQLEGHFPECSLRQTWNHLQKISERAWPTLQKLNHFPPSAPRDLYRLLPMLKTSALKLVPDLLRPFSSLLSESERSSADYMKFLDQQLLISTQSTAYEVSTLIASLGLMYPSDTYYPLGGMGAMALELVEKIRTHGGTVRFKTKVIKIEKTKNGFMVHTNRGESLEVKRLISSLPFWNHQDIGPAEFEDEIKKYNKTMKPAWGAMTAYFAIRPRRPIDILYQQVHTSKGSLFYSFSKPNDQKRAPAHWQTVTVSAHCADAQTLPADIEEYTKLKEDFALQVHQFMTERLIAHGPFESTKIEVGTPKTFAHFTGRLHGRVGGLPHGGLVTMLRYPGHQTPLCQFYRIGDTVFPGQGIVGVIAGAYMAFETLKREIPL